MLTTSAGVVFNRNTTIILSFNFNFLTSILPVTAGWREQENIWGYLKHVLTACVPFLLSNEQYQCTEMDFRC